MWNRLKYLFCRLLGHNYIDVILRGTQGKVIKYKKCSTCGHVIK